MCGVDRECEREKADVNAREEETLREIEAIKRKGGKESEGKRGKMRETNRHNIPGPLPTASGKLPGLLGSSICCFPGFCFLRPAPRSVRSETHVCLCPTEVLLKVPHWHLKFKAFTVHDSGCRWGTCFRDESFPDTSHHGRELYRDPGSWLRICRYLEGGWNGLSWRKAKGIVSA